MQGRIPEGDSWTERSKGELCILGWAEECLPGKGRASGGRKKEEPGDSVQERWIGGGVDSRMRVEDSRTHGRGGGGGDGNHR